MDSGYTAGTLLPGCDGKDDIPAYFFRTSFELDATERYNRLVGAVHYDDGIILYINGQRIAAGDDIARADDGTELGRGFDENLQYGGASRSIRTLDISHTDLSMLCPGRNTIAVELHNCSRTSSDIWFDIELSLVNQAVAQSVPVLCLGSSETEMHFSWYTDTQCESSVLVAPYADLTQGELPDNAAVYPAATARTNTPGLYSNHAAAYALEPGTRYAYQLVNGKTRSQILSFTTAAPGPFSFALAGDTQIRHDEDADSWANTLRIATTDSAFEDAAFLLCAGDQVDQADNEEQYLGFLNEALRGLPVAAVIGNHDSGSHAHSQHFFVPNESRYGSTEAGSDYYFTYRNALFMVLNGSNRDSAQHEAFLRQTLRAVTDRDITWKIVAIHQSIFSAGHHAEAEDILQRRQELAPLFRELGVNVVLSGHDHVYCRSYIMDGLTPITDPACYSGPDYSSVTDLEEVLYITANSSSGSKFYSITDAPLEYAAVVNQEKEPNLSCVSISDTAFTITTYRTTDMQTVDRFTIYKTPDKAG